MSAVEIDETSGDDRELGRLVARGLRWSFAGSAVLRLGTFASGLVLARLLSPHDFGVYAVGAVALMVTASISDVGIEPTLVRWPGNFEAIAPTAKSVMAAASVVMFGLFWIGAPSFARLLNAPDAAGLVRLMSVGLLIRGAFAVNSALATRTFRQHVRSSAEVVGMVVEITLIVVLALAGFGPWSLAWGHLASNLVVGTVLYIWSPVPGRPRFDPATARLLLREGLPLAGAALMAVAVLNVDYLLVGSILGAGPLGLYVLAFSMASWPISLVSSAVNRVSVAGFARLQHQPRKLSDAFARTLGGVTAVTVPFCVLLAALSLPAVRFAYGDKWAAASAPLRFLAAVTVVRVVTLLATDALVASGRGRTALALNGLWLVALVPAVTIGAHLGGIQGVGIGQLVAALGVVIPAYMLVLSRRGFAVREMARSVRRPLVGAVAVFVVAIVVARVPGVDWVRLGLGGLAGMSVYLLVVRRLWVPLLATRRTRLSVAGG